MCYNNIELYKEKLQIMIDLRQVFDVAGLNSIDLQDNSNWVAVIGSRKATDAEKETAYLLGKRLAKKGKIVVSGLALSVDEFGHKGAIDGGGQTIAIVSTPMSSPIYPKENQKLAEQIKQSGCIIHPFKTNPKYQAQGFNQFQKRLIERSILNAYVCPNIVVVKNDSSPITGGTKWATYYGQQLGHSVFRIDCNNVFYPNPAVEKCQVFWIRELDPVTTLEEQ